MADGHRAVRGRRGGPARDAVDVATFHAAKGLEWATVHLAGAEDGFVPIAHARTAAAKAEEVRLLYVAMTRAERELRITFAEQRTFNGRVVDRRRRRSSTRCCAARPRRPRRRPPSPPTTDRERLGRTSWPASGRRSRRAGPRCPPSWRRSERGATSPPAPPASSRRRCSPTTCWPGWRRRSRADVEALGAIRGVGPILAQRFGEAILDALAVGDVA